MRKKFLVSSVVSLLMIFVFMGTGSFLHAQALDPAQAVTVPTFTTQTGQSQKSTSVASTTSPNGSKVEATTVKPVQILAKTVLDDQAGLLSPDDQKELADLVRQIQTKYPTMGIGIFTTDSTDGKKTRDYGDDLFEANQLGYGSSYDGFYLLIDMEHRQFYTGTFGEAIRYLTDDRIDRVTESMQGAMKQGNYRLALSQGLSTIERYLDQGIPTNQHTVKEKDYSVQPLQVILSSAAFVLVMLITKVSFTKKIELDYDKHISRPGYNFSKLAQANYAQIADTIINQNVSRIYSPVQTTSGSHSGGSSGTSTTHTTSGGHSSGGGGGSF